MCLSPCLTMCCQFAAVYIYCGVHGCQADHSRDQSVFIELFFVLLQDTAAALCTHTQSSPLRFKPSFRYPKGNKWLCLSYKNHQNMKLIVEQQQTTIRNTLLCFSIIPAAVQHPFSSQTIISQWQHAHYSQ